MIKIALLICTLAASTALGADAPDKVQYNRDIRPIFGDTCFKCHGFDKGSRKGNLRMDVADEARKAHDNGTPIVPGHPEKSEAWQRIISDNPDDAMPPIKSHLTLTAKQKELVKKWIEQGAEYQPHWAFIPVQRPAIPTVKNAVWATTDLDKFVLARLEAEGMSPSPEAEKRTLIRRVSFDLTGLPPTSAEVDAFVADTSPKAYENVVDRLLASPHYGERMAMQWLDGARYADSNGYEKDNGRNMWPWRDWIIAAFNNNKPFDQFTVEQIAGDLLPDATLDQKVATGFNRNHRVNEEGGIIPEEWRVESVIDRVETTSAVWLGLTMGCARCHDHKYDPITQKEFYQFCSFFNNVPESGNDSGPMMKVPVGDQAQRLVALDDELKKVAADRDAVVKQAAVAVAEWESHLRNPEETAWDVLAPVTYTSSGGATMTPQSDLSLLVAGPNPAHDIHDIRLRTDKMGLTGLRLEALTDPSLTGGGAGRSGNSNFELTNILVEVSSIANPSETMKVKLSGVPTADYSQNGYDIAYAIDADPQSGWAVDGPTKREPRTAFFSFAKPVGYVGGTEIRVRLFYEAGSAEHVIGRPRLAITTSAHPLASKLGAAVDAALKIDPEKRSAAQKKTIAEYYLKNVSPEWKSAEKAVAEAKKSRDALDASITSMMVMTEMPKPREAFILVRGQYDKHGEKVTAGTPASLPALPADAPVNRLGLARWIVDPGNPLTARVWVNRAWERLFGIGIVRTSENFGTQCDPPSNQELLDFLASEFVRLHWDMKAMQKTLVMSATYRQSSAESPEQLERDPDNRLLARGPRFRLPAELVRDNALAMSGLLVDKIGGPPARPYQPQGIWDDNSVYGNLLNYKHDAGEGLYRRSMYTIWKRTAAPPQMTLFDMPSREVCVVKRSRTNTPLQALVLLNDTTYVEASRALAQRMLLEGGDTPASRIAFAFKLGTAHLPTAAQSRILLDGLTWQQTAFRADVESAKMLISQGDSKADPKLDPAELAAYTMTASVILNLDETFTKE